MSEPVQAFGDAILDVFERMTGEVPTWQECRLDGPERFRADLVSVMRVRCDAEGWIRLAMDEVTGREVLKRVLGYLDENPTPEDLIDCAAEILNVIAGGAKARLVGSPHHFALNTPRSAWAREDAPVVDRFDVASHLLVDSGCGVILLSFLLEPPAAAS
jgi:CheY-specific phosphatase CheX